MLFLPTFYYWAFKSFSVFLLLKIFLEVNCKLCQGTKSQIKQREGVAVHPRKAKGKSLFPGGGLSVSWKD